MATFKGLPLYKIVVSSEDDYEEDESLGMTTISIVDYPAIEVDAQMFEKQEESKQINFAVDEEEGIIFGPAIRCGMPIFRRGGMSGGDYYVVFQKDQIKRIVEKYSKKQRWNNVSLQHDGQNINDVVMVSMFLKDSKKGINPKGFEEIEEYSLFVGFKVLDIDLWNKLKTSDNLNGFSIEIMSYLDVVDQDADEFSAEDELEKFINDAVSPEEDKKKSNFVSKADINKAIDSGKMVDITIGGETVRAQVLEQGAIDKRNVAVYYIVDEEHPEQEKWQVKNINDIQKIKITSTPVVKEWGEIMKKPSYKAIEKILDDMVVPKTATVPKSVIDQSIEDGLWVEINYNDEKPNPHTGARQTFIVAHGMTKRGNECLRVLERYGDSRSVAEEGNTLGWRLLLTKRIINIRPMPYVEKWDNDDLFADYNPYGDKSMSIVINHYKPKNFK